MTNWMLMKCNTYKLQGYKWYQFLVTSDTSFWNCTVYGEALG